MATAKVQDLPPEGGYKKIPFARIPARTYFTGKSSENILRKCRHFFCNIF